MQPPFQVPIPSEGFKSSLGDAITTDEALAESTVDQLSSLERVTLVRFVMELEPTAYRQEGKKLFGIPPSSVKPKGF